MECYIGEIRAFSGSKVPEDWHICDGAVLLTNDYQALYSIIGNKYGGTAPNNFALPNLQGTLPIHQGNAPGLTERVVGQTGGAEGVAVMEVHLPAHTHAVKVSTTGTAVRIPANTSYLSAMSSPDGTVKGYLPGTSIPPTLAAMDPRTLSDSIGAGTPHENKMPGLVVGYIISLKGLYPPRPF